MKVRRPILIVALLALSSALPTRAGAPITPERMLAAELRAEPATLYSNQVFRLMLLIHTRGVTLDQEITYSSLFATNNVSTGIEKMGDLQELVPEKRQEGTQTTETRRFVCPVRAVAIGQLRLAPSLHVTVVERRAALFSSFVRTFPQDMAIAPLSLSVLPLPAANRPADFSGAVGSFLFDLGAMPSDVAVGDLITLRGRISGQGDQGSIAIPRITSGPHFKVYDPKPIPGAEKNAIVFEQTLVPQNTNAVQIPAMSFSYFDPAAGAYRTLTRGPFPIRFHAPEKPPEAGTLQPSVTFMAKSRPGVSNISGNGWVSRLILRMDRLWNGLAEGTLAQPTGSLGRAEMARLAPAHTALPSFEIPKGSTVYLLEPHGSWIKVSFSSNRGWIPRDALAARPTPLSDKTVVHNLPRVR